MTHRKGPSGARGKTGIKDTKCVKVGRKSVKTGCEGQNRKGKMDVCKGYKGKIQMVLSQGTKSSVKGCKRCKSEV